MADFTIPDTGGLITVEPLGDAPMDEASVIAYECASTLAAVLARLELEEGFVSDDQCMHDAAALIKLAYLRVYHLAGALSEKHYSVAPPS